MHIVLNNIFQFNLGAKEIHGDLKLSVKYMSSRLKGQHFVINTP